MLRPEYSVVLDAMPGAALHVYSVFRVETGTRGDVSNTVNLVFILPTFKHMPRRTTKCPPHVDRKCTPAGEALATLG